MPVPLSRIAVLLALPRAQSCDTKPVLVDVESYLFLEIFYRWLVKAGEIEVTEMLPDPARLFWKEPGGRHGLELRTLMVPRS